MGQSTCDETTIKKFRTAASISGIMMIMSIIGIVISILILVDVITGMMLFPFSSAVDPPYMAIIFVVTLVLSITLIFSLKKIKEKTCSGIELPFV
jgi:hypothetical protein